MVNDYDFDLSEFCADGARYSETMIPVSDHVSLRVITFTPPHETGYPAIVFVAGWISLIIGWQEVLQEMTRDFTVYYVETREKKSAEVTGKASYDVDTIGNDIIAAVKSLGLQKDQYLLFGSSLGGTVILDCVNRMKVKPKCLVLVVPNAEFRVPKIWKVIIWLFYPGVYILLKPFVKWYLKYFRLNVKADYKQYRKYCRSLDAADPWKLKKAAMAFSTYQVWPVLKDIQIPTLLIGASKDTLHEPENLENMVKMLPNSTFVDMDTNKKTHTAAMVDEIRKYIKNI